MIFRRRQDELEQALREARPRPADAFAARLVAEIRSAQRPRASVRRRLALAGALTAAIAVALGSVGGLSYAASIAAHAARNAARHVGYLGSSMPVAQQVAQPATPARDQYGGGGGGGGGGDQGGDQGGDKQGGSTQTTTAEPDSGGTITAPAVDSSSAPVAVTWEAGTFTAPVAVTVDTRKPANTVFVGAASALVSIVATDPATGQPLHALGAPMAIVFEPPTGGFPRGYVPVISTDGSTWRATSRLGSPSLPADANDGFYVWKAGDGGAHPVGAIVIFTRHLTVFAVLSAANVTVSESGRKVPQAGSGLFGDPTRNHNGAPRLARVGDRPAVTSAGVRLLLPVRILVDEQAVLHFAVFDRLGAQEQIVKTGTVFRGKRQYGPTVKDFRVLVLRPGTITASLRLVGKQILPGYRYRLRVTAVDFDGKSTVRVITFRG